MQLKREREGIRGFILRTGDFQVWNSKMQFDIFVEFSIKTIKPYGPSFAYKNHQIFIHVIAFNILTYAPYCRKLITS